MNNTTSNEINSTGSLSEYFDNFEIKYLHSENRQNLRKISHLPIQGAKGSILIIMISILIFDGFPYVDLNRTHTSLTHY